MLSIACIFLLLWLSGKRLVLVVVASNAFSHYYCCCCFFCCCCFLFQCIFYTHTQNLLVFLCRLHLFASLFLNNKTIFLRFNFKNTCSALVRQKYVINCDTLFTNKVVFKRTLRFLADHKSFSTLYLLLLSLLGP